MPDFSQIFSRAFERMTLILFKPFSYTKWLNLVLIAILAGAFGGGGSCSGNFPDSTTPKARPTAVASDTAQTDAEVANSSPSTEAHRPQIPTAVVVATGLVVLVIFLVVSIIFAWLNGRFRFIFYDAIVHNGTSIREPWRKYKELGNSYFRFTLCAIFGMAAFYLLFAGIVLGILALEGVFSVGFGAVSVTTIILAALVLLGIIILFGIFMHCVAQFVIPIMAIDNAPFMPSLRVFLASVKANPKPFLLYLPIALGIGIGAGIATLIVTILAIIVIFIACAAVFGIPYLIFGGSVFYVVYAVLAGIVAFFFFLLLMFMCGLPAPVFFRSFTLYYLGEVLPRYNAFASPRERPPAFSVKLT